MAKKAVSTEDIKFISTNSIGRSRVKYISAGPNVFFIVAHVASDEDGVYVLKGVLTSRVHAFQLRNRIAGKGVINAKLWVRMVGVSNPFEVQE